MTVPFKVCCMLSAEEAEMAIAAGALAVGLVGEMPNGPGPIADQAIKKIADHVFCPSWRQNLDNLAHQSN